MQSQATWPEARISGRLRAGVTQPDRRRLGIARVELLHFLENDPRIRPEFERISECCGLLKTLRALDRKDYRFVVRPEVRAASVQLLQQAGRAGDVKHVGAAGRPRTDNEFVKRTEAGWRLAAATVRKRRQIEREIRRVAMDTLHLDYKWVERELLILYLQRIVRYGPDGVLDGTVRPPAEDAASPVIKLVIASLPFETRRSLRARVHTQIDRMLADDESPAGRRLRKGGAYLKDYVFWFFLRRSYLWSERSIAREQKTSRARVRKGVNEVERLFRLIVEPAPMYWRLPKRAPLQP